MIYYLLAIPLLVVLYIVYFRIMVSKAAKSPLYHPEVSQESPDFIQREFHYKSGDKYPWKGRFYAPMEDSPDRPCVVLFHGEVPDFVNPKPLNWKIFHDYGQLLAKRGLVALIFNHRSSRNTKDAAPPRKDLLDLLEYIRSEENDLPFHRDKILLWSFSGGSYICLNWIIKEQPGYIKGLVSYYGVLEGKESRESAIELIAQSGVGNIPPVLLVKADKDRVRSSIKAAEEFYAAALGKAPVRLLSHSGPHGFDVLSRTDETIKIIDQTLEFCEESLSTKDQNGGEIA